MKYRSISYLFWPTTLTFVTLIFLIFLVFPLYSLLSAVGEVSQIFPVIRRVIFSSFYQGLAFQSILLAILVTTISSLISVPLSYIATRSVSKISKSIPFCLLLITILPPFVGVLGARKMLGRNGLIPTLLIDLGLIDKAPHIFGEGSLWGVAILQALHLFPLLTLLFIDAWRKQDREQVEAVVLTTSSKFVRLKMLTIPLLFPSWLYGALLASMASIADIGTPLLLNYRLLLPVYLYESLTDAFEAQNGFIIIGLLSLLSLIIFTLVSRLYYQSKIDTSGRSAQPIRPKEISTLKNIVACIFVGVVITTALIPHLGVMLLAFIPKWITAYPFYIPEISAFGFIIHNPIVIRSIFISFGLSLGATIIGIILSLLLTFHAYYFRSNVTRFLLIISLLPLAVPGIAFAFGYLQGFRNSFLDPIIFPLPLLLMAYTIRKLPFSVASSQSALSFIARELIEVAQVHGASLWQVWRLIVFPLIWRPIFGGAILTFAFSMLEVSDSLILAREEKFYPIAKAIYALALRPDGPAPACAFGFMLGVVLTVLILWAHKLSKRSLTLITILVTLCLPTYLVAEKNSNVQEELIILSPHWDGLKYEITQAFNEYTKNSVKIRWLDVGGTSDILRFVEGEQQHIPRADVLFGGGTATFRQLATQGFLMKVPLAAEIRNAIADNLHGTQLHDQNSYWYSAMLTGFGILCNTLTLQKLGLSLPSSWADLSKPEWHSWISLADPRKSGSAHVIIELILQKHGWNDGWKILQKIRRNISIITSSSSELPWLIATGEVACGGVVDSYASHAKSYADTNLIFIMPSEETSILGDPIGVLNNAPHPKAAIKFLNFILSNKVQKLLMSRKGDSDGPKKYELYQMSVIPSLYYSLGQQKTDIGNPFSWQPTHNYSDLIARSRWHVLNDLVGIYLIDAPLRTISVSEPPISEEELAILTQNKSWLTSSERQELLFNWREILWSKH